jgi:hypothetical protein
MAGNEDRVIEISAHAPASFAIGSSARSAGSDYRAGVR